MNYSPSFFFEILLLLERYHQNYQAVLAVLTCKVQTLLKVTKEKVCRLDLSHNLKYLRNEEKFTKYLKESCR